jgi:type I restriction enzyme, S subunit
MADPGKVGIIEKDVESVFASYLIRLNVTSKDLSPYFLFYTLSGDRYQGYITGASTGTTRKSASAPVIVDYALVVPTKNILNEFEITISSIRKMLNVLLDINSNLRKTRDLLLPKLINGELDLSELEIQGEKIQ